MGRRARKTTAATAERKLATCQLEKELSLIPAPPVEKRRAAPASCSRDLAAVVMTWRRAAQCLSTEVVLVLAIIISLPD
jgi:hypothetical protein